MKRKFRWRAFISFGLTYIILVLLISGIVLFMAPPGRYAHWVKSATTITSPRAMCIISFRESNIFFNFHKFDTINDVYILNDRTGNHKISATR